MKFVIGRDGAVQLAADGGSDIPDAGVTPVRRVELHEPVVPRAGERHGHRRLPADVHPSERGQLDEPVVERGHARRRSAARSRCALRRRLPGRRRSAPPSRLVVARVELRRWARRSPGRARACPAARRGARCSARRRRDAGARRSAPPCAASGRRRRPPSPSGVSPSCATSSPSRAPSSSYACVGLALEVRHVDARRSRRPQAGVHGRLAAAEHRPVGLVGAHRLPAEDASRRSPWPRAAARRGPSSQPHPLRVHDEVRRAASPARSRAGARSARGASRRPRPSSGPRPSVVRPTTSNVFRSPKYAMAPVSLTPMRASGGRLSLAHRPSATCWRSMPLADCATSSSTHSSFEASSPTKTPQSDRRRDAPARRVPRPARSPTTRARHARPTSQPGRERPEVAQAVPEERVVEAGREHRQREEQHAGRAPPRARPRCRAAAIAPSPAIATGAASAREELRRDQASPGSSSVPLSRPPTSRRT